MFQIFLQVLGAIFLLLIVTIVLGVLFVRWKIRSMLHRVEQSLETILQPPTIRLEPSTTIAWEEPETIEQGRSTLSGLGYHDAGQFVIAGITGLKLWAFVNPSEPAYAVLYEHPVVGCWVDLVTRYQDGTSITYSSAPQGGELDQPPGHGKEFYPEAEIEELHQRFLEGRPQKPTRTHTATQFTEVFEQAYAEEMAWRNARGGPTEREIRAIAERTEIDLADEEIDEAREAMAWQAIEALDQTILERFLATTRISAADWEDARDFVVVVHDQLPKDALLDRLEEWLEPEDLERLATENWGFASSRASFARFNGNLPTSARFVKLGRVETPIEADIYRASTD